MQRLEANLKYSQGIALDDYLAYIGTDRAGYMKSFEEDAKRTVMHQLVLEKIMELEHIEATEEEIDAKVAEQAASVGKEPETYKKTLDPRQLEYIEGEIRVNKAFEFLMANNEMEVQSNE